MERIPIMIPKLRRKFISITAAALFVVILLLIAAINFVFVFQTSRKLPRRQIILSMPMKSPTLLLPDSMMTYTVFPTA